MGSGVVVGDSAGVAVLSLDRSTKYQAKAPPTRISKIINNTRPFLERVAEAGVATIYERFIAAIRGEGVADPDFARGAALQRMLDRAEQSAAQHGLSLKV